MTELDEAADIRSDVGTEVSTDLGPEVGSDGRRGILDIDPIHFPTTVGEFDHPRIVAAVREILIGIGEDPDRDGLRDTPERVARAYAEMFSGLRQDPESVLATVFDMVPRCGRSGIGTPPSSTPWAFVFGTPAK